ncbi:hypothetical protein EOM09_04920 [bacterium]|nr:hypothetical protein [bacterium]
MSCRTEEIYKSFRELSKFEKIKSFKLVSIDDDTKTIKLTTKVLLNKMNISVVFRDVSNDEMELEVISKSNKFSFIGNRNSVKKIVNLLLKLFKDISNPFEDEEFDIGILEVKNKLKSILYYFCLFIIFAFLVRLFIVLVDDNYYMNIIDDPFHYFYTVLIFTIILLIGAVFMSKKRIKRYSEKRTTELKNIFYELFKGSKKSSVSKDKDVVSDTKEKTKFEKEEVKKYLDKGMSYLKKLKEEKPKVFWGFTFFFSFVFLWAIWSMFFGVRTLEGTFVQQHGSLTGYTDAFYNELTFKNGVYYPSGSSTGYEYKIKGNKIYITYKGNEEYIDIKIKNKNTIIVGDGEIDEVCYGNLCGPNSDGVYIRE